MTHATTNGAPPPIDAEQLRLDLEDAQTRLARLRAAVAKKTILEEEVARLTRELKNARRKLKECVWDLQTVLAGERSR